MNTCFAGLFSTLLVLMTSISLALPLNRLGVVYRPLIMSALAVLLLIPAGTVSALEFTRGFIGDLSITSLIFLSVLFCRRVFGVELANRPHRVEFCLFLAPIALVFYPFALGFSKFDPYALGYGSEIFLIALLFASVIGIFRDRYLIAVSLSLTVFLFAVEWYESTNLWDYLIDPFVAIYALAVSAHRWFFWFKRKFSPYLEAVKNDV